MQPARLPEGDLQLTRARLTKALADAIDTAQERSALVVVSVDNLASINASFGFEVGDEVIATIDRIIRAQLGGRHRIARYASNRLGIIAKLHHVTSLDALCANMVEAVGAARIETSAVQLVASITMGAFVIPDHGATPAEALRNALRALDEAGRRHVPFVLYDPSLDPGASYRRNIALIGDVIRGLDEGRMRFVLQPIVNARTGETELYECLLRLTREDGSSLSAGEFIEVAEQLGLAREIDRRTLKLAIDLLAQRQTLHLSLNVSQTSIKDESWLHLLRHLLGERQDIARRLTLEITETALTGDMTMMAEFAATLRQVGCSVAIDDFGTGYTSLMQVKHLELDMIKIDGTFIKNLPDDPRNAAFVKAMVDLARTFHLKTVAEHVGDERCAEFLRASGVDYLQGFHFGQPHAPEELPDQTRRQD